MHTKVIWKSRILKIARKPNKDNNNYYHNDNGNN